MNDYYTFKAFLLGVICGVVLTAILNMHPSSLISRAKDVLSECEKSLPRDQQCKLSAVPVKG